MEDAGDKGLSVGEASDVTARGVTIRGAKVGVAVKDGSRLDLESGVIAEARYGVALYVKKPEFGSPDAEVRGVVVRATPRAHCAERGARLLVDESPVAPSEVGLQATLEAEGGEPE